MEKISFVTNVSKSGDRIYVNIPYDKHGNVAELMGSQVKVTIEDI